MARGHGAENGGTRTARLEAAPYGKGKNSPPKEGWPARDFEEVSYSRTGWSRCLPGRAFIEKFIMGVKAMLDYEKLYRILFNGITDALEVLDKEGDLSAKLALIRAQRAAEEHYIEADDGTLET